MKCKPHFCVDDAVGDGINSIYMDIVLQILHTYLEWMFEIKSLIEKTFFLSYSKRASSA